jgi:hypothetical protein
MMSPRCYWGFLYHGTSCPFQQHATAYNIKRDACAHIWSIVEPTLSPHIRDFARNIELLRKSKEDCRIDAALREKTNSQDFFDQDVNDADFTNLDSIDRFSKAALSSIWDGETSSLVA